MELLVLLVHLFSFYLVSSLPARERETQATDIIKQIIKNGGDRTMAEIFREIDKAVGLLDAESQIEHVKWKNAWKAEEQMRLQLFKDAIPKLSSKEQQKLIRIALIHQNSNLTINEKKQMLYRVQDVMDSFIKEKLESVVAPEMLYNVLIV